MLHQLPGIVGVTVSWHLRPLSAIGIRLQNPFAILAGLRVDKDHSSCNPMSVLLHTPDTTAHVLGYCARVSLQALVHGQLPNN